MDPKKFKSYNVLEDQSLREGKPSFATLGDNEAVRPSDRIYRYQRILRMANDTTTIRRQGIPGRL